jgi:hypothetical protein
LQQRENLNSSTIAANPSLNTLADHPSFGLTQQPTFGFHTPAAPTFGRNAAPLFRRIPAPAFGTYPSYPSTAPLFGTATPAFFASLFGKFLF